MESQTATMQSGIPTIKTYKPNDKGAEIWFTDTTPERVATVLVHFLTYMGFTLESNSPQGDVYAIGSSAGRLIGGGLVNRQKYALLIMPGDGFVYASLTSLMSGWSGSALGAMRERSARGTFVNNLQAYLYQEQTQSPPVAAIAPTPENVTLRTSTDERVMLSPDRKHWWNGQVWVPTTQGPPDRADRSPDGQYWWDGATWRPNYS